jgi:hypothetical protein
MKKLFANHSLVPRALVKTLGLGLLFFCGGGVNAHAAASNSIARVWNERAIAAIRIDRPHPPAQARNYFSLSVCMYDAWAAYDPVAVGYVYRGKHTAPDIAAARSNAISYAAFRMLVERHAYSQTAVTASNSLAADTNLMVRLGYDPNNNSLDTSTPTGVGNAVYAAVSAWFINDGSRQTNGTPYPANPPIPYPDYPVGDSRRYTFINTALATSFAGIHDTNDFPIASFDVNHWQRLFIQNATNQAGFAEGSLQGYLGVQWLGVRPFSLARTDSTKPWIDPGPPPFFGGPTHAQFVKEVVAVITADGQLSPDTGAGAEMMDISPAAYGNNSLDFAGDYGSGNLNIYDGHGYPNNPVTGQPYAPNLVKRGDFARVCAEFWADGPNSETPPGHWNVLANYLADHPLTVKKIGGVGPVVDDLEWDVKMYFALNAATHDAACVCWGTKRYYDGWRPFSAIRYLAGLGQSTDPGLPSYNANGLPLIPNQIELVTEDSVASGHHPGLTPGKIAVLAWPGPPADPVHQHSGVQWIHADNWSTYQRPSFVTPAFPGYFSGHSTFSRSAAELLAAFTGSPFFPGGLGTYTNYVLGFENGPSTPMILQWATYFDAADQAGISRIWGGIHPPIDNLTGRRVGAQVGKGVWALAKRYFDGSVVNTPVTITRLSPSEYEVRYEALRGFYYDLRSSLDISLTFTNDPPGTSQPFDALSVARTNTFSQPSTFYRAVSRSTP